MNDNLIYELEYEQEIGEELSNKLNDNYIISTIEIIFDRLVNESDIIIGFYLGNINVELFLNCYYNNIIIYDVNPILRLIMVTKSNNIKKSNFPNCEITKDECFFVMYPDDEEENVAYKLRITLKPILYKYYYENIIKISFEKKEKKENETEFNLCSNTLSNINQLENYVRVNSNIDINNIYKKWKKCMGYKESFISIFENINSNDNVIIGNLKNIEL